MKKLLLVLVVTLFLMFGCSDDSTSPDNEAPGIPSNPVPSNGSSNIEVNSNLTWSCNDPDGDALTYDVYFGTSSNPPLVSSNQSSSTYDLGTMNYETTYYWKIIASDGELETASPIWDYTTESEGSVNHPPAEPYAPTPINNADNVSISTSISWSGSDPDGDVLTYDVYFGTDSTPDNGELLSNNQSGTNYSPATLEYETVYYWKIVASDGEYETEGDVWSFTSGDEVSYGDLIFVEGGSFEMGDHFNEGSSNELPVHDVTLNSFYIGQYEVTQGEYAAVMGSNPAHSYGVGDNYPVYYVTWYNAVEYCNALSIQEGLTPCYDLTDWSCDFSVNGYRLPTEAEWEYASRGGMNWTDNYRYSGTTDNLGAYAWYNPNSGYQSHEVGTKLPNQLDIYDMSGNVWEWCNDWYSSDYYSSSPVNNPTGPDSGSYRLIRGGGWSNDASVCRVANCHYYSPGSSYFYVGFRILRAFN